MIKKVKKTIERYELIKKGDRLVAAVSGGPDSTALLVALAQIASFLDFSIIVSHFNHGLRGDRSDEDEKYSQELAKKMGLIFVSGKMDQGLRKKGESPEEFYRQQRYQFLNKVLEDYSAQKIALGHNIQDQAETILLNLLRGSGLEGLRGILPIREGKFIRPLIDVSRTEIIAFLNETGISYCQDNSNESDIYLRNKIRGKLIPYLKEEFNPKIEENLVQMAQILRQDDEYIRDSVQKAMKSTYIQNQTDRISLNIEYVKGLAPAIRSRLLKKILESLNPEKNGFSFVNIKVLEKLLQAKESGKRISLPLGIEAKREYDNLILTRDKSCYNQVDYEYPLSIPGTVHVKETNRTISIEKISRDKMDLCCKNKVYLDLDKIKQPFVLRNRKDGDRFQPLGMKGQQKIKSLFINQKIPRRKRNEIMLLVDQNSVIWIENMHLSDRVKISPQTINILSLEMINS
jgi:tRNA(Ile)-lysidine synthetase, N-terminal domain/tRNA(Ile)-lysidine synthetase, C-terminal domain